MVEVAIPVRKTSFAFIALLLLPAASLRAQQPERQFPGAGIAHPPSFYWQPFYPGKNLLRWQADTEINLKKNVALALRLDRQSKSLTGLNVSFVEFLAGPRFKYRAHHVTLFAQALVGGVAAHAASSTRGGFAAGMGGGVDLRLNKYVTIRAFQLDSIHYHINGAWRHDLRGSVGIVFTLDNRR